MKFWGLRGRAAGVPIPKWRRITLPCCFGELVLGEQQDEALGRWVRVARFELIHCPAQETPWPDLLDAQILTVRSEFMVLGGLERDLLTKCDRAQSWVLFAQDPAQEGAPLHRPRQPAFAA